MAWTPGVNRNSAAEQAALEEAFRLRQQQRPSGPRGPSRTGAYGPSALNGRDYDMPITAFGSTQALGGPTTAPNLSFSPRPGGWAEPDRGDTREYVPAGGLSNVGGPAAPTLNDLFTGPAGDTTTPPASLPDEGNFAFSSDPDGDNRPPGATPPPDGVVTPPPDTNTTMPVDWQNPAGSTATTSSRNAPRLEQVNGQWVLTEHGQRRPLQPNEVAAARAYVEDFWRQFPTGFQPGVGAQTNDTPPPGGGGATTGTGTTSTRTTTGQPSPAFAGNRAAFHGFNFDREQNQDDSAKDSFLAGASAGADDLRWQNSETAPAWFDEYVRPNMEARGWVIDEVDGDKAFVHTRENPEGTWIDWVEGIDGPDPHLAWQDQSYGGDAMAGGSANAGGGGGGTGRPDPTSGVDFSMLPQGSQGILAGLLGTGDAGGDQSNMQQILAELQALMRGQPSTLTQPALESAFGRQMPKTGRL